jgi:hypothetical protein
MSPRDRQKQIRLAIAKSLRYRAVNVLHKLIDCGDTPVMNAVFVGPGKFIEDGRSSRSEEHNSVDNRYVRVIVDELWPRLYGEYSITRDRF